LQTDPRELAMERAILKNRRRATHTLAMHRPSAAGPANRQLKRLAHDFARGNFDALLRAADALLVEWPDHASVRRARAVALLRLGRPAEAAAGLAGAEAPGRRDAEAASLRGLALFKCGDFDSARQTLDRALAIDRRFAPAWANLGALLAAQDKKADAARAFRKALEIEPSLADARCDYARLLIADGRKQEACKVLELGAADGNASTELYLLQSALYVSLQDRVRAVSTARAAVAAQPRSSEARGTLGNALMAMKRHEEALAEYRASLRLAPGDMRAIAGMVEALRKLRRFAPAKSLLTRALRGNPESALLFRALAGVMVDRKDYAAALKAATQATVVAPDDAAAYFMRGAALLGMGRTEQAQLAYEKGLSLDEHHAGGWNGLALTQVRSGNFRAAIRSLKRGLKQTREHPECLFSLGLVALTLGDWATGWPLYEWRWLGSSLGFDLPRPDVPGVAWWAGGALAGKRLLVLGEQGHGDNMQFVRLLKLLPSPACVRLAVSRPLHRLMRKSLADLPFPVEIVDLAAAPLDGCDAFITLMSIPARVGLTQETLPAFAPWLHADAAETLAWQQRLAPMARPRVGFVWRGNPELTNDRWRSTELAEWEGLLSREDVTWVSLQKLEAGHAQERRLLASHKVIDWTDELKDFAATSALIQSLDLVIAVDTSVAHLAGALDKPVWLLNRASSEWRWGWRRRTSIWYPSMRIFNQDVMGEWSPVFQRMQQELRRWSRKFKQNEPDPSEDVAHLHDTT
jgi:tetratricopeptide (TPR) repeat protein